MSIFDKIKHAIFGDNGPLGGQLSGHQPTPATPPPGAPPAAQQRPAMPLNPGAEPHAQGAPAQPAPSQSAAQAQPVDIDAILTQKAEAAGRPSNWRTSIVDLLQLLGLDSSLAARKELADELGIHAGADGSAEENIALHRAVMKKLAENGGKVPADLQN